MAVGRYDVKDNWENVVADALEFMVGVNIAYVKTAGGVESNDLVELGSQHLLGTIENRRNGTKTDVTRDAMEKREALYEEQIHAKRDVAMVFEYGRRNRHRLSSGQILCHAGPGRHMGRAHLF